MIKNRSYKEKGDALDAFVKVLVSLRSPVDREDELETTWAKLESAFPEKTREWIESMFDDAIEDRLIWRHVERETPIITVFFMNEKRRKLNLGLVSIGILKQRFERDILELCTGLVKIDKEFAMDLWGSIANVGWYLPGTKDTGLSFRHVAGLIADMRGDGSDYMDWYMCVSDGCPRANVMKVLAKLGWKPVGYPRKIEDISKDIFILDETIKWYKVKITKMENERNTFMDELVYAKEIDLRNAKP